MLLDKLIIFIFLICCSKCVPLDDLFNIQQPLYTKLDTFFGVNDDDNSKLYKEKLNCGIRGGHHMSKIVGGQNAQKGEFPWQVSLQLKTGLSLRHICGGAVINQYWVVTAGHCVSDIMARSLILVAGDNNLYISEGNEQKRNVNKIITNNFDFATFSNDIALLKVEKPFRFEITQLVAPVCLPARGDSFEGLAVITGWGRLREDGKSPDILQHVTVPLIDKKLCHKKYTTAGYFWLLNECQVCAYADNEGKDACQGDSGGPLVCLKNDSYYLCGIVSWGIGCARREYPGVFTDVTCFLEWIKETIAKN